MNTNWFACFHAIAILTSFNTSECEINFLNEFDKIFSLYNPFKIFKKKHLTFHRILTLFKFNNENNNIELFIKENEKVFELKRDLLDFTKKNLTTEILAKYILEKFKKYK